MFTHPSAAHRGVVSPLDGQPLVDSRPALVANVLGFTNGELLQLRGEAATASVTVERRAPCLEWGTVHVRHSGLALGFLMKC